MSAGSLQKPKRTYPPHSVAPTKTFAAVSNTIMVNAGSRDEH